MIEKALVSWIRRIKTMSLSYFSKNNVNLPGLKISGGDSSTAFFIGLLLHLISMATRRG